MAQKIAMYIEFPEGSDEMLRVTQSQIPILEEIKEARKEPHSKDNTQKLLALWQKFSDAEDF